MGIKVKIYELVDAAPVLDKLFTSKMDTKMAYALKRITEKVSSALKPLDRVRMDAIKKYGIENKENGTFEVPEQNRKEFSAVMEPELTREIELNTNSIPYSLFINSTIQIAPSDVIYLEKFIDGLPKEK
jgi:hypothetical protein